MSISSRTAYTSLFSSLGEAIEFENQCLFIGRDLLPAAARAVLDDLNAEPAPEYWSWLASQLREPAA